MTRQSVYGIAFGIFLATIGLSIASIIIPEWISFDAEVDKPPHHIFFSSATPTTPVHYSYGLHTRCSSLSDSCEPFPTADDCTTTSRKFCSLWRTVGFLMSIAVVVELAGIVGFVLTLTGGKQRRDKAWRIIVLIVGIAAVCQIVAVAIVASLEERDDRFFAGWHLGTSFVLACVAWGLQAVTAAAVLACVVLLPEEGGYELIPDRSA